MVIKLDRFLNWVNLLTDKVIQVYGLVRFHLVQGDADVTFLQGIDMQLSHGGLFPGTPGSRELRWPSANAASSLAPSSALIFPSSIIFNIFIRSSTLVMAHLYYPI